MEPTMRPPSYYTEEPTYQAPASKSAFGLACLAAVFIVALFGVHETFNPTSYRVMVGSAIAPATRVPINSHKSSTSRPLSVLQPIHSHVPGGQPPLAPRTQPVAPSQAREGHESLASQDDAAQYVPVSAEQPSEYNAGQMWFNVYLTVYASAFAVSIVGLVQSYFKKQSKASPQLAMLAVEGGESQKIVNSDEPEGDSNVILSNVEELVVGGASGVVAMITEMPMLTWKFCSQSGAALPAFLDLPAWYNGVGVQAVAAAPITALQMWAYGFASRILTGTPLAAANLARVMGKRETILASILAGVISAFITGPVDMVTLAQQKLSTNMIGAATFILQETGPLNFFRGFLCLSIREAIFTVGMFFLTPIISEAILKAVEKSKKTALFATAAGSLVSGTVSGVLSHPFDTMKTCIQSDVLGETYTGMMGTFGVLMEQDGIGAFFRGVGPRVLIIISYFFIATLLRKVFLSAKANRASDPGPNPAAA